MGFEGEEPAVATDPGPFSSNGLRMPSNMQRDSDQQASSAMEKAFTPASDTRRHSAAIRPPVRTSLFQTNVNRLSLPEAEPTALTRSVPDIATWTVPQSWVRTAAKTREKKLRFEPPPSQLIVIPNQASPPAVWDDETLDVVGDPLGNDARLVWTPTSASPILSHPLDELTAEQAQQIAAGQVPTMRLNSPNLSRQTSLILYGEFRRPRQAIRDHREKIGRNMPVSSIPNIEKQVKCSNSCCGCSPTHDWYSFYGKGFFWVLVLLLFYIAFGPLILVGLLLVLCAVSVTCQCDRLLH